MATDREAPRGRPGAGIAKAGIRGHALLRRLRGRVRLRQRRPDRRALHVPGVALRGDGSIQSLQSREEVERFFQAAVDGYRRDGCVGIRFTDLEAVGMGGRSALGTVTWELLREDGGVLRRWRQSYNLVRVDGGWQILASTYHVA